MEGPLEIVRYLVSNFWYGTIVENLTVVEILSPEIPLFRLGLG